MQPLIDFHGTHGPRYVVYETISRTIVGKITPEQFPHPKQVEYFDAREPHVLFGGARGGGKTEGIIWDHIYTGYLIPGSVSIIFRKTIGELQTTIIERFQLLPSELVGKYVAMQSNRHMLLPNGSKIRFASAADKEAVRKYLSGEFIKASFDEWGEWSYSDWKFITGSVRTTRTEDIYGRRVTAQVKGATNPGGEGGDALNHLFGCDLPKSPAIGMDPLAYHPEHYRFIPSLVGDNPAYAEGTQAGNDYREMLKSQPPGRRDAWLLGKWTGFEGQFFDIFDASAVQIPHDEVVMGMAAQKHQPVWISLDYGKVHHSHATWHTFLHAQLDDGTEAKIPVTYRELLCKDIGEAAVAQEVARLTTADERPRIQNIYRSPELGSGSLSRAAQLDDVFITKGLPKSSPAYNDREDGWAVLYGLLSKRNRLLNQWSNARGETVNTCAGWLVSEDCPLVLEALPWATSDPDHDGDIKKAGDSPMLDVLDDVRYGIASYIRPEEQKPYADRMRDAMNQLPAVGSSRFIKYLQMRKEEKLASQPYYTGQRTGFIERRRLRG